MDENHMFYLLAFSASLISVSSIATLNVPLIILALSTLGASVLVFRFWYIFEAYVFRKTNLIMVFGDYELSGNRRAVIRKKDGIYIATAAALLNGSPSQELDRDALEGVISRFKSTFRLVTLISGFDTSKILDALKTKRASREIALARTETEHHGRGEQKAASLKREIMLLDNEIFHLTSGSQPLRLANYVIASASAANKLAASESACERVKRLSGELGALTGSSSELLCGNDLVDLLKLDFGVVA